MPRKAKRRPLRRVHIADEALATLQELTASVGQEEEEPAPAAPTAKRSVGRPRLEHPVPRKDPSAPRRGRGRPRLHPPPLTAVVASPSVEDGDAPLISSALAAVPAPQPISSSDSLGSGGPSAAPTGEDGQTATEGLAASALARTREAGAQSDQPPARHAPRRGAQRRTLPLPTPPHLTATPLLSSSNATGEVAERAHWDSTPSLPACLAAVFGWHLVSYGVTETGFVCFTLQRHEVRVAVEGASTVFLAPTRASASALASAGVVRVNGTLMPIGACAEHLRAAADSGLDGGNPLQTAPPSLASSSSSSSTSTPQVQAPSPMSPNTEQQAAQQQARKRERSRSPSPASTSAASLDASLLSPTQVLVGATAMQLTEAPAQGDEPREGTPRAPSPPLALSEPARVKVKTEAAPSSTPSSPTPPRTSSDDEEVDRSDTTRSLGTRTLLAPGLSAGAVAPSASSPLPRAPSTGDTHKGGDRGAAEETATSAESVGAPTAGTAAPVTGTPATTVIDSPTMRLRRVVSRMAAAHRSPSTAAAAEPASLSLPPSTAAATSPPTLTESPAVAAVPQSRVLFRAPFEFRSAATAPASAPRDEADAGVDGCRSSLARLRSGALAGYGFTARSSRLWLAHTHAASRTLACMPPPLPSHAAASDGAVRRGQAQCTAASSDAEAALFVRQLLRRRWRAKSSLWAAMDDSLRMAVGSGHLRGDPLGAGVLALQAGEDEQLRYDGLASPTQDALAVGCGRRDGEEFNGMDEDGAGTRATELPEPTFPAPRPHALLPVSGRAVVEAQHRIAESEAEHDDRLGSGEVEPRYRVCTDGIPPAERIAIDHTYSTRGSYQMASTPAARHALAVLSNPHEDLRYHVYKYLLTSDLREAVESEGTLFIGPDGVAPVQLEAPPKSAAAATASPASAQSSGDEDGEDEDGAETGVRVAVDVPAKAPRATAAGNGTEYQASTDIDYILRYRPAIRRIPMPDVESRYGM